MASSQAADGTVVEMMPSQQMPVQGGMFVPQIFMPQTGTGPQQSPNPNAAAAPEEITSRQQIINSAAKTPITTASLPLWKLPRTRLSECVEWVREDFDATYTANLDGKGLAALLWMLCRVRPDLKATDMRVNNYLELYKRFEVGKTREETRNPGEYKQTVASIEGLDSPFEQNSVLSFAKHLGFNDDWVGKATKKRKGKAGAPEDGTTQGQLQLEDAIPPRLSITDGPAPVAPASATVPPAATIPPAAGDVMTALTALMASFQSQVAAGPPPAPAATALATRSKRRRVWRAGREVASASSATGASAPPVPAAPGPVPAPPVPAAGPVPTPVPAAAEPVPAAVPAAAEPAAAEPVPLPDAPGAEPVGAPGDDGATQPAGDAGPPECVFCRDVLGTIGVEALECGHTYHTECLNGYMEATGKDKSNACPFKCHGHLQRVDFVVDDAPAAAPPNDEVINVEVETAVAETEIAATEMFGPGPNR